MTEDLLQALFERTRTPMLLVTDERCYCDANEAACELLGYGRDRLRSMKIDDLVGEEVRAEIPALWETFLKEGAQVGEIELVAADGRRIAVSYSATANIVPGVHLAVFPMPGKEDPVLDETADEGRPRRQGAAPLTGREREVLTLLALGASGADIAKELYLSPETIRTHTRRAREKLGARSRSQAIALALKRGEIEV